MITIKQYCATVVIHLMVCRRPNKAVTIKLASPNSALGGYCHLTTFYWDHYNTKQMKLPTPTKRAVRESLHVHAKITSLKRKAGLVLQLDTCATILSVSEVETKSKFVESVHYRTHYLFM